MSQSAATSREKAGLSPGVLIYVGEPREEPASVSLMIYDQEGCSEREVSREDLSTLGKVSGKKWIQVTGSHDVNAVKRLGSAFGLHPLVLEDLLNTEHRPKAEDYDDYIFIVLKTLKFDSDSTSLREGHVGIVVGRDYVISFVESGTKPLEPVKRRILGGKRRIRRLGPDYLAYALIDVVVDEYFHVVEDLGDIVERLEEEVFSQPHGDILQELSRLKRVNLGIRKTVSPLREAAGFLVREDSELLSEATRPFLRDIQDHLASVIESVGTHEQIIDSLLQLHQNTMANRLNEVMKILTVVATIFIPLTFIAGIYGMNFKNMPELEWSWGYPMALILMVGVVMAMLLFLHRKKWL